MPPMLANNQLMTRIEAAEALSISLRKLDLLTESGDLQAVRIGRAVRFRRAALELFIEIHETRKNPRSKKGASSK